MVGILGSLFAVHAIGIDTGHAPLSGFGLAGALLAMLVGGMLFSGDVAAQAANFLRHGKFTR